MDAIKQIQTLQNELTRFTTPKQVPQAQTQTPAPATQQTQAAVVKFDSKQVSVAAKSENESPKEDTAKSEVKEKEKAVLGGLDVEA